jgi:hypothetical protein
MAQYPLVRREPVSASCSRRPDEGLETQQYSLYPSRLTVLVDRRLLGSQCCLSTRLVANNIRLTKRCTVLSSRSNVTRGLPDLGKSFTLLVCVCYTFFVTRLIINKMNKVQWVDFKLENVLVSLHSLKTMSLGPFGHHRWILRYFHGRREIAYGLWADN